MSGRGEPEAQAEQLPPPRPTYGAAAALGAAWIGSAALAGKAASFAAQWALGWLLARDDFALWALATSSSAVVMALRGGGTARILVQRGPQYAQLARPSYLIALAVNLGLAALLSAAAPAIARYYGEPGLPKLIWILALSLPLSTPAMVLFSKLSIDMRFRDVARITTVSSVLRYASSVSFALAGLGPASFVLPLLITAVYESLAGARAAGWIPRGERPSWALLVEIFHASKWILLGTAGTWMVIMGPFLVVGKLDREALGPLFFGFQIADSATALFSVPLMAVLVPSFVKIRDDPDRLAAACAKSMRQICLVGAPASLGLAVVADSLIRLLWWNGKWDSTIPVVVLLCTAVVFRSQWLVGYSILEARGRWKALAWIIMIDAAGIMGATAIGAAAGGLIAIAAWTSGYRVVMAAAQCLLIGRAAGVRPAEYVAATAPGMALAAACAAAAWAAFTELIPLAHPLARLAATGLLFAALYLGGMLLFMRRHAGELWALVAARRPGR
jgi:PST family polysaccharide transporter